MKFLCTLLSILSLWFSTSVFATNISDQTEPSENVVKLLYRDFGWEITNDDSSKTILVDQSASVLKRYFTPKLAGLTIKDRTYVTRTKEVGHIDFVLLCGSQDPDGIRNIKINQKAGKNIVEVTYDQNSEKNVMNINFNIVKTGGGWRISDVHYKSKRSKAFPDTGVDFSLLNSLSQPY